MDFRLFVNALTDQEHSELLNALTNKIENKWEMTSAEMQLVIRGDMIAAIKCVKSRLGCGLREARDIVVNFEKRL